MNPDKLLTLLMGRCWHEPKDANNPFAKSPCIHCGKTLIHWPHGWFAEGESISPSYSDPRHRDEFFTWLTRERGEMWEQFLSWALRQYEHPWAWEGKTIPWLFFQSPSRPRDLMAEWLRLDSTIRDFGWEECHNFNPNPEDVNCLNWNESCFCKSGKIRAEWAKYAKEGKDG